MVSKRQKDIVLFLMKEKEPVTAEWMAKDLAKIDTIPEGASGYIDENVYYPSHKAVDFYHHTKKILPFLEK